MDATKQLHVLVVGERDFPFSPLSKVEARQIGPLLAKARERIPDLTYEDLLRFIVAVGAAQVETVYAHGAYIERGGLVRFALDPDKPRGPQEALFNKLLRTGILEAVAVSRVQPEEKKDEPVTT